VLLTAQDFGRLYRRDAPKLLRFFATKTWDPETAVDLLADTFLSAFEARDQYRGRDDRQASAWITAIARRQLADYYRHGAATKRATARQAFERRPLSDEEYERIEDLASTTGLRLAVRNAYSALAEPDREVLRLRILEERSYPETAAELGVTEQTARARTSRALRRLRQTTSTVATLEACHVRSNVR
jgi:RNA polymerase sigma factor (sigma-70 family)